MKLADVKNFIASNNIFPRPLVDQAVTMIYEVQTAVRLDGNHVAHSAEEDLVRDAVVHGEPGPDVVVLTNIFECVFDKDLSS